jgi:hypothetical protein
VERGQDLQGLKPFQHPHNGKLSPRKEVSSRSRRNKFFVFSVGFFQGK